MALQISTEKTADGAIALHRSLPKTVKSSATLEIVSPLIRNKSGQVVKSSLRSSRQLTSTASLTIVTAVDPDGTAPAVTKRRSLSAKSVSFDSDLEKVRLFLAKQRPTAVSRDGSPTDDTATETEFPAFIFGSKRSKMIMNCVSLPVRSLSLSTAIVLTSLEMDPDATRIKGLVNVRNIAFQKSITARFTFDEWQLTHEVMARYVSSSETCTHDVFEFVIRINTNLEGKTLSLALRYNTNGKDYWDSNNGQNYKASFSRTQASTTLVAPFTAPKVFSHTSSTELALSSDEDEVNLALQRPTRRRRATSPEVKSSFSTNRYSDERGHRTSDRSVESRHVSHSHRLTSPPPRRLDSEHLDMANFTSLNNFISSEDSTPSMTSPTSPSGSQSSELEDLPIQHDLSSTVMRDYESVVTRFCFFTGLNDKTL